MVSWTFLIGDLQNTTQHSLYQHSWNTGECLCTAYAGVGHTFSMLSLCEETLHTTISGGVPSPVVAAATDSYAISPVRKYLAKRPKVDDSTSEEG